MRSIEGLAIIVDPKILFPPGCAASPHTPVEKKTLGGSQTLQTSRLGKSKKTLGGFATLQTSRLGKIYSRVTTLPIYRKPGPTPSLRASASAKIWAGMTSSNGARNSSNLI